mgnify:CR=1 FL=1
MSKVLVTDTYLTDIADSIRSKNGTQNTYKPSEMSSAIDNLPTGSGVSIDTKVRFGYSQSGADLSFISSLDYSSETNFQGMFYYCQALTTAPTMDTSSGTNFTRMFYQCSSLATTPIINTSNATNLSGMFGYCVNLITAPSLNTSKVTSFGELFTGCTRLTTVAKLDANKATSIGSIFNNCTALQDLGGLENLGQAYLTTAAANYTAYRLSLSNSNNLTYTSLMNVINNLYDIATKGCNAQGLLLGSTNLAKLTSAEIAIATNKGWTVS